MVLLSKPRRRQTVAKLGAALRKAIDTGDVPQVKACTRQMIAIVRGDLPEYSDNDGTVAFQWLVAEFPELDQAVREFLWRHPETLVEMIKALRAYAATTSNPAARQQMLDALKRHGFDDESLCQEDGRVKKSGKNRGVSK